jgi:hypothetical protein
MDCGKALPTHQPANYAHSQAASTSPEPTDATTPSTGADSSREQSVIEVESPPSDDPPASKVLEGWTKLAVKLESESPRRSSQEIWQEIIPQLKPVLHKVEHFEPPPFHHRGHSDGFHISRNHVSHFAHHTISTGASYINPSTLQVVSDALPYPNYEHWSAEEGHLPASHEEYALEGDSQVSSYNLQYLTFPPLHSLQLPYPTDVGRDAYTSFV